MPEQNQQEMQPSSHARKPYVKPLVQQLQYMVDQHVSLAASCKTVGAVTGPTLADCKMTLNTPCAALGS